MATYLLTPRARADLASGAAIGRRAEDVRAGYFRYPAGAHVLFYQCPAARPLVIVRILHQRMDLPRHV